MNEEVQIDISEFYKFHRLIERSTNVDEVLNVLINTVNKLIPHTDMAIAYLYDSDQKVLRLGAGYGVSTSSMKRISFQPGESLTGKVFLNKKSLACANRRDVSKMMSNISTENLKWYQEGTYKRAVRSSINVPLMDNRNCIGTFTLNRYNTEQPFSQNDIKLLHTLTGQAAGIISYIRMSDTLEDSRIKEQFSQALIRNPSQKHIIDLLETKMNSKFSLDSPGPEPANAISIIHNKQLLGYLSATRPLSDFTSKQLKVVYHAADALTTLLMKENENYEVALRHRSEDFERALNDGKFETLLKYIHVKKDTPVYCFLISATSHGNDTFARQLENLIEKHFPGSTMFLTEGFYIIVSPSVQHLEDFAEQLYKRYGMITGTGKARPIMQLNTSYNEARIAASQPAPSLVEYSTLGYKRLWGHFDEQVKYEFITDHIGLLLEHSPEHLTTLGALIENGRTHKSKTAEQLYIHTNTLYQRLRKIESILEVSLQNERQWMNIVIAYEMYVDQNIES